jgi:uncharacterized protein YjaZ
MHTKWIATNEIYHAIIEAADTETRERLFTDTFVTPFMKQFTMLGGVDVVKRFGYLMPEDLTSVPESLRLLEASDAWTRGAEALRQGVERWKAYDIPLKNVTGYIVLLAKGNPEGFGYAGAIDFAEYDKFVVTYDRPDARNMALLEGAVVHELHHLVRGKVYPVNLMTAPLSEYIPMEGLAESFSAALYGEDRVGPYVTQISADDLERARRMIGDALEVTGFDKLRGYVFGEASAAQFGHEAVGGMPTFGGYAVGYHAVQAYLKRTGKTIEEATFVSGEEIMRESGYFG